MKSSKKLVDFLLFHGHRYTDSFMIVPEIKRLSKRPSKILYDVVKTSVGDMMVGVCDDGICWMGFDLDGTVMRERFPQAKFIAENDINMEQPLAVYGTDFQVNVWKQLLKIPDTDTVTYGDIARNLGKPKAFRAVGSAIAKNPISGVIPCHRVLPASGGVGNYLWGSEKKASLLNRSKGL
jgi:AraC family transcriptional regulator of adaptative response/methylated-DNA-[protein]-cysteine methyltransferase